jgi:hypothetical protein
VSLFAINLKTLLIAEKKCYRGHEGTRAADSESSVSESLAVLVAGRTRISGSPHFADET